MFVGIDISKDRLEVHLRSSTESFAVARDGRGLEQLVARLVTAGSALVLLEATGGFEITVAAAIAADGLLLAVVNTAQIRAFAHAIGRLAKMQVDFGEKRVAIGGEVTRVYLFVATLGHSRRLHVRAFLRERQACWFEGLESAFRTLGGVPEERPA